MWPRSSSASGKLNYPLLVRNEPAIWRARLLSRRSIWLSFTGGVVEQEGLAKSSQDPEAPSKPAHLCRDDRMSEERSMPHSSVANVLY